MKTRLNIIIVLITFFPFFASTQSLQQKLIDVKTEDYPGVYGEKKIKYEKITGKFYAELNPADSHNSIITDIELAEKNQRGWVEYTTDFFLIKPKNMKYSNGVLRYDAPNRGNAFNTHPDSVLMARGYVFLSAAWQGDVKKIDNPYASMFDRLYLDVPTAKNNDGSEITGIIRVEFAPSAGTHPMEMALSGNVYNSNHISYPPAELSNKDYILTKRVRENDPKRKIDNNDWAFSTTNETNPFPGTSDETKVSLRGGFDSDYLYELIYEGKNPKVMGIGMAAVRDIVIFFEKEEQDSDGNKNPVAGKIKYTLGTGTSQSGNFMKTFIHLGFNESLSGDKVFDGVFPIVGARQNNINMRFAVPGGGGGPRTEHRAYGQTSVRAFSPDYYDDISGNTGGIFSRSEENNTIPKVFMLLTSAEFWALQGSMLLTDAYGLKDIEQPEELRIYYIAGAQHSVGPYGPVRWDPERTTYPAASTVDGNGVMRALWIDLEEWVINGTEPPASRVPSIKDKTLIYPEDLKYPQIKGVNWTVNNKKVLIPALEYRCIINNLSLLDFGPEFNEYDESGTTTLLPPAYLGKDYAIMVSEIDKDGNEIGGIRTPELVAPLGTNLGYNYDARTYLEDLSGLTGSYIPFHKTKKERLAAGDERLSLEERYGNKENYVAAVKKAAEDLVKQRLLLPSDAKKLIQQAKTTTDF